jgi:predicted 3-demethylubiquinone-9 3-methyltransferase (glyoxalase superfamily)
MASKQKIKTFLWFDKEAEEAAKFYTSTFKNSRITTVARYGDAGPGPKGSAMTVAFELEGQEFLALNGGPQFKFTEAISLLVTCDSQQEIDELWSKLTAGGQESQCGWLKDRYGLSWQIVPSALPHLLQDPDPAKSARVMQAMLQMKKMDLARLERASRGV